MRGQGKKEFKQFSPIFSRNQGVEFAHPNDQSAPMIIHALHIESLEVSLYLGCTEAEREDLQTILLFVDLTSPEPLKGALSDRLEETICYEHLEIALLQSLNGKTFHLIEQVGHQALQILKALLPPGFRIQVRVRKYLDPHRGSRSFTIDFSGE